MAFQPVPDTARVAMVHTYGPLPDLLVNVFYFRRSGQWGLPDIQDLASQMAQLWDDNVCGFISSSTFLRRVEVRGERAQTDVSFQLSLNPPIQGRVLGDPVPPQVAFCVTHLTGFTGRSRRGRTYFGYLAESEVQGGVLAVGSVNGLVNALQTIRTTLANAGWTHVVVSRVQNRQRLPVAETYPVISYRATDQVVDTMRTRAIGRGA